MIHPRLLLAAGALLALAACGSGDEPKPRTAYGPEGVAVQKGALLAPVPDHDGTAVGAVECRKPKKLAFHVHAHLAIYVDGALRPVPAGIGMVDPKSKQTRTGPRLYGPRCYYGLHLHAQDGVIHVEAPTARRFTLGEFFALWDQPLTSTRVGPARGPVRVYVDGRVSLSDPADIVLRQREVIQIVVGKDVPPQPVDWSHF